MDGWRPARGDDNEAIVAMYTALYEEDPGPEPTSLDRVRMTLANFGRDPARGRAVVLDVHERPVGYAFLVPFWSNELGGEICVVDELYIQQGWRRKGHATSLIKRLSAPSNIWPGRPVALELEITPTNKRARVLYERLGFLVKRNTTMRLPMASRLSG
jgi:GNAT superfamily N-acetyltransferase